MFDNKNDNVATGPIRNNKRSSMKQINICTFNARSLRNKTAELSYFVNKHNIHILAISETWLGPSISDSLITIPGFQAPFRNDRNAMGGGVCLFVSTSLPCRHREDIQTTGLEIIWVEFFNISKRPLLVGCCYRPPSSNRKFYDLLEENLDAVIDYDILLVGDFNAKNSDWCETDRTTADGLILQDLLDSFNLTQLCSQPSHLDNDGLPRSLLDLAITNRPDVFKSITVHPPLGTSDHLPISLESDFCFKPAPYQPHANSPVWLFHCKSEDRMQDAFDELEWESVFRNNDIDELWHQWCKKFFEDVSKFIPKAVPLSRKKDKRHQPWFTAFLRSQIVLKNRMYRRAMKSKSTQHYQEYRAIRNKTNNLIKSAKCAYYSRKAELLAKPNCPPSTWWRTVRSLCGLQQGSSSSIPPLLDQSKGSYVSEVIDKTELFNDVFINQNATLNESSFPIGPTPVASTFNLDAVTPEEVKNGLKSLPSKTSVGEDGISYRLLQEVGPGVVGPLVSLFNKSISLGSVPTEWKMAVVTPIFKGGRKDRRIPANYRPISLTSCVARLLEKIINKKLLGYLTKHNLIFEHQSGFLTGHSTETQLCYLIHRWQMALDKNQMVHAAFLDLSKAYDRVSIPALLHKLSCVGLSKNTLSWFTAFLQSRKQCVQIDGQKSSWQVTKSGIPQGTVLGPTLFLIYINDFPSCIDNDVSIFADDTTVYTIGLPINQNATAISLTADLNNADLWARIWGMLFNADKSEILSIRSQRAAASLQESDPVIHPISMNGVRVPACQKHKHLGVVINNSLSWSDHIDDVFTKCARHVGIVNSLRKKLSKRCLTRIYKGYIRPRLEYACAVWSGGNTSKLLKLQQKFCRQHQVQLPNLSNRFKFHTLTLFYKIRNGLAPTYLSEILPETLALSSGRNLRRHVYPFPRINKSSTMQSFLPRATVFWNELPASIQSSSSLHSFKAKLRDLLKI